MSPGWRNQAVSHIKNNPRPIPRAVQAFVQAFFVIKGADRDFSPEDSREQINQASRDRGWGFPEFRSIR
jgi:hypothetical protein